MLLLISLTSILTIFGNFFTILAFWKESSLKEKPSDLFILSLSISDAGSGFMAISTLQLYLNVWISGKFGCQVYTFLASTFILTGRLAIACISADRLLLVSEPYPLYLKTQTKQRVIKKILILWGVCAISAATEMVLWDLVDVTGTQVEDIDYRVECRSLPRHTFWYNLLQICLMALCPLLFTEIASIRFFILLRRRYRITIGERYAICIKSRTTFCCYVKSVNFATRHLDNWCDNTCCSIVECN